MQEDEPEPVAPEPEPSAEEMLPPVLMAAIAKRQSGAKPSPMPSPKIVKPVASPAPKPTGGKSTPKSSAKKMNATFAPILPGSARARMAASPAPRQCAIHECSRRVRRSTSRPPVYSGKKFLGLPCAPWVCCECPVGVSPQRYWGH